MVVATHGAVIYVERELGIDDFLLGFDDVGIGTGFVAAFTTAELWLARTGMTKFVFLWHELTIANRFRITVLGLG